MLSWVLAILCLILILLVILAFRKNSKMLDEISKKNQKITELENIIVKLKSNLQTSIEALEKADSANMDLKLQNTKVKFENKILKEKEEK
ncbi:MAG: hypothetical protein IJT33_06810 [Campylobacter sp.]|nr:hypothetical protein [Campylobacter sp.]MBQ7676150.1 hypothetical protein [Campylobacter sp.]MBQ9876860.1 hypothetical protein [Campylobacter sp.]